MVRKAFRKLAKLNRRRLLLSSPCLSTFRRPQPHPVCRRRRRGPPRAPRWSVWRRWCTWCCPRTTPSAVAAQRFRELDRETDRYEAKVHLDRVAATRSELRAGHLLGGCRDRTRRYRPRRGAGARARAGGSGEQRRRPDGEAKAVALEELARAATTYCSCRSSGPSRRSCSERLGRNPGGAEPEVDEEAPGGARAARRSPRTPRPASTVSCCWNASETDRSLQLFLIGLRLNTTWRQSSRTWITASSSGTARGASSRAFSRLCTRWSTVAPDGTPVSRASRDPGPQACAEVGGPGPRTAKSLPGNDEDSSDTGLSSMHSQDFRTRCPCANPLCRRSRVRGGDRRLPSRRTPVWPAQGLKLG